jgi:hypothetical protein
MQLKNNPTTSRAVALVPPQMEARDKLKAYWRINFKRTKPQCE